MIDTDKLRRPYWIDVQITIREPNSRGISEETYIIKGRTDVITIDDIYTIHLGKITFLEMDMKIK